MMCCTVCEHGGAVARPKVCDPSVEAVKVEEVVQPVFELFGEAELTKDFASVEAVVVGKNDIHVLEIRHVVRRCARGVFVEEVFG
jgi:hypothetical protein